MSKYYYFRDEIEKQAKVISTFGKVLQAAGRHPKITVGTVGGLLALSQVPRIANRMLGLYLMSSEPKKRKLMKQQLATLEQIKNNTSDNPIIMDPRRIPVKKELY